MNPGNPEDAERLDADLEGRLVEESQFGDEGVAGLSTDWSVPWSDLMMVLFVLFVILYCYERAERDVHQALGESPHRSKASFAPSRIREPSFEPRPRQDLFEESRRFVRSAGLDDVEVVLRGDQAVQVNVQGETFFDLGKADLRPATQRFLGGLAEILRHNRYEVEVVGHTDTFPISSAEFPTNWELSAARATRVTRFLIERGGLDPRRFTAIGHSMYRPVAPNTDLESMARNRRVEIVITRRVLAQTPGEEG